jgi:hypothetical protein
MGIAWVLLFVRVGWVSYNGTAGPTSAARRALLGITRSCAPFLVHIRGVDISDTTVLSSGPIRWTHLICHCILVTWWSVIEIWCSRSPYLWWIGWIIGLWLRLYCRPNGNGGSRSNGVEKGCRWMDARKDLNLEFQGQGDNLRL